MTIGLNPSVTKEQLRRERGRDREEKRERERKTEREKNRERERMKIRKRVKFDQLQRDTITLYNKAKD